MNRKIILIIFGILVLIGLSALMFVLLSGDDECTKPTITMTTEKPIEGEKFEVNSSVSDASSYEWFLDDQPISELTGATVSIIVDAPGEHSLSLVVNGNCTSDLLKFIVREKSNPDKEEAAINISCSSENIKLDEEVTFTAEAEGATAYAWTFGESGGIDSKEKEAKVRFTSAGTRDISVAVTINNKTIRKVKKIMVLKGSPPPVTKPNTGGGPAVATAPPMENYVIGKLNSMYSNFQANSSAAQEIADKVLCKDYKVPVEVTLNGETKTKTFSSYIKSIAVATIKSKIVSLKLIKGADRCVSKIIIVESK